MAGNVLVVECCFTSTETVGLLGTGAQDVHQSTFTQLLSSDITQLLSSDITQLLSCDTGENVSR